MKSSRRFIQGSELQGGPQAPAIAAMRPRSVKRGSQVRGGRCSRRIVLSATRLDRCSSWTPANDAAQLSIAPSLKGEGGREAWGFLRRLFAALFQGNRDGDRMVQSAILFDAGVQAPALTKRDSDRARPRPEARRSGCPP